MITINPPLWVWCKLINRTNTAIERFSPAGPLAVLPLNDAQHTDDATVSGYRRSVVWICPKGEEQQYLDNDELFLQTLQQAFGQRAGKFVRRQTWGVSLIRVLAERQVQGRCVIMGNSAHVAPCGRAGFNLCMRDADTLSKMMARQVTVGKNIGEAKLLKAYETARQTDQKQVIRFCDAVVWLYAPEPCGEICSQCGTDCL